MGFCPARIKASSGGIPSVVAEDIHDLQSQNSASVTPQLGGNSRQVYVNHSLQRANVDSPRAENREVGSGGILTRENCNC